MDGDKDGAWDRWKVAREVLFLAALAPVLMFGVGWLRAPDLPERAPDFQLVDLDGQTVALSDYAGQTVVLNFWATWCGPCRVEAPSFSAFADANPEIPVLGLVADGPPNKVRAASRELGISYRVLSADEATLRAYGVGVFPTTVVVNPDGTVRWAHAGLMFRPQLALLTSRLF